MTYNCEGSLEGMEGMYASAPPLRFMSQQSGLAAPVSDRAAEFMNCTGAGGSGLRPFLFGVRVPYCLCLRLFVLVVLVGAFLFFSPP